MKKLFTVLTVLCAVFVLSAVNVRDFGAKGDGKTDDTAAIQKAVFYLSSRIKMDRFRLEDGWYTGSSETHVDELLFPAGTYKISHTIFAPGSVAWRGQGKVKIIQTDPEKDLLYCEKYRRAFFFNLSFSGGKTQLQLWNRNWNATSVSIRDCEFIDSGAPAVRSISRRVLYPEEKKKWGKRGKITMIPPYDVTVKNGIPHFKANSFADSIAWYTSNIIYIKNTSFLNCLQAFEFNNDGTLLDNCRIRVTPRTKGPVMIAGVGPAPNMLAIWNLKAEAAATEETQFWIKNEGYHVVCNDSVFKSVNPMRVLDQTTLKIPGHPIAGSITFNRCRFEAQRSPDALILFRRVPSVLICRDNVNTAGNVALSKWLVEPDEAYLKNDSFRGRHQGIVWPVKLKYNFIFGGNKNITENLPSILEQFRYQDHPLMSKSVPVMPQIKLPSGELHAAGFGVKADGKTDDAAALGRALAAAAKVRKTLVIPQGRIRLASTVKLPEFVSLRGEGMPIIFGDKRGTYDLFTAEKVETLAFHSLLFRNAGKILDGKLNKKSRLVSFRDCLIYDTGAVSIRLAGTQNSCLFHASGSLWNGAGSVDSACKYNEIVLCWMANNYWMDDTAFFINRGGTVLMRSPFFVPYVSKNIKRTNTITGETKVWELGGNLRWIDNYGGKVYVHTARGGGEAGGYSTLRQMSPGGIVYMEGGLGRFTNKDTTNCLFYAQAAPELCVIAGVSGYPIHTLLGVRQKIWEKAPGAGDFPLHTIGVMYTNEK